MAAPSVGSLTARWYGDLPEIYRVLDGRIGYPLLRFLSLVGDPGSEPYDLLDRIDYVTPSEGGGPDQRSDLLDPDHADVTWLPWLAQLVGVQLTGAETEAQQRQAIKGAISGYAVGTKSAIAAAAQTVLTGSKFVRVQDHSTDTGAGGEWDVLVVTRASEVTGDVAAAISTAKAKPAGVKLWFKSYTTTIGQLQRTYTTVGALSGHTLLALNETGLT